MYTAAETLLPSWELDPWSLVLMLLTSGIYALLYARGWRQLRRQMPHRFRTSHLVSFCAGLAVVCIALASPLHAFADVLLTAHMVQHLLLMMAAPPLILYGAPYLPLLHSLPRRVLKHGLGPLLAWSVWHRCGRWLMHPLVCWLAFVLTNLLWHMPALYELALRSQYWHEVQHLCFFCAAMLFWWPVIQPWPSQPRWPRWAMIPYLFVADFQNTALSAFLVFCERVVYPTYVTAPRLWGMSALEDQAAAGAMMWVCGSLAFLLPLGVLTINVFGPHRRAVRPSSARARLQATKGGQP